MHIVGVVVVWWLTCNLALATREPIAAGDQLGAPAPAPAQGDVPDPLNR